MARRTLDCNYDLHIVSSQEDLKKSSAILAKKFSSLLLQCRTGVEARSHYDQSTYILFKQNSLFQTEETYKKGLLTGDLMSHWGDLTTLARFVDEFCHDDESQIIEIHISKNDLEAFRMVSFIASFCLRAKRSFVIKSFEEKEILNMYEPPINESTQLVLFSIIDLLVKHGDFPQFEELREHHFSNLRGSRKWDGAKDNKYVATLYASLRTLQRLGLVNKEFHEKKRKMIGIKPTVNGYLSVLFSDAAKKFGSSNLTEDSTDQQPADMDDIL